ncbi:DUF2399 domain-containing protein [Streptomyces sp. NPDC056524]|uniref:DUF2399 domain-containing protein n=1 Tax=Streptomyces sp. NPDC056524 TaxID=3345851 RepID=UPI0036AA473F
MARRHTCHSSRPLQPSGHRPECPSADPLVSLPAFAARRCLLRHLYERGAALLYHGDFDWGGLRIPSALLRRVPWRPWRYTAADYRVAALARPDCPPLAGQRAEGLWDPDLQQALLELALRPSRGRDGP